MTTACGCTAATAKNSAEPGEKSEVTATFKIGDRTGAQQKMITVVTDDPTQSTTSLTLKVIIPQVLELQPTFRFTDEQRNRVDSRGTDEGNETER